VNQIDARSLSLSGSAHPLHTELPTAGRLLEALPLPSVVVDRHLTIVAANRAWERLADRTGDGVRPIVKGWGYLEHWPCGAGAVVEADRGDLSRGLQQVLEGELSRFETELCCTASTGHQHQIHITASAVPESKCALVTHQDVTATRQHEAALRDRARELADVARQLRQSNQELDQFAYITSHDLKAPLRGIANLSRWIEEDMGDALTPQIRQQMDLLRGRVHRMQMLIEGLLQYSRIGRVRVPVEEVDVSRLLAEVAELLAPPPRFRIEVQGLMPVVRAQRVRLQQVFMNLIGNAIRHHHRPDGRITITCQEDGAFYRFCVADDGPGIDPRFHQKIFMIFQTLQPRDQKEAAGVGLSLVKKIVEEQGGVVTLQSQLGQGASFCFTWAKQRPQKESGSPT